jgi:hypothetical protein
MRKIIQISGDKALCSDGSVWVHNRRIPERTYLFPHNVKEVIPEIKEGWTRLIDIPQDEVKDE